MFIRKEEIYAFLYRHVTLQIYCIGDLDDFFDPYTNWYRFYDGGDKKSLALLYNTTGLFAWNRKGGSSIKYIVTTGGRVVKSGSN